MLQQALSLSFLMFSLMLWLSSVSTANSNIYVRCSQLNFTLTTPYESNVNSLFTSLVDSASIYNFNKFEISPQNDAVFGLFQCRGDLNSLNCKDCMIISAISELKTACPMSTGGDIQLEGCYVKYDNMPFFGVQEKTEVCRRCGPSIGYNSNVLNRIDDALIYLVGGTEQYYREGDFGSIEGVAQCVQDLSLSDCQDCLSEACGRLRTECEMSTWGDMYLGKCYIRYDMLLIPVTLVLIKEWRWEQHIKVDWVFFAGAVGGSFTFSLTIAFNCCNIHKPLVAVPLASQQGQGSSALCGLQGTS
ncbi:hypothetical protein R6Q59_012113 [Mikania micrantha]